MKRLFHGFLFICQLCFYWLIYPIANLTYGNKRVWIVCERGDDARDNGYWMFKHLRAEHMYVNVYYLINKHSADFDKVSKLGKVVKYKSFKHWLLYCAAEVRMTTHLAAFAPGNFVGEYFKHHKQKGVNVFLQHGITHNEFPSNYFEHNGSDLFICGAKPEFDHISKNCNYPKGNVVFSGFARFDGLHDLEVKKQILIMPSWRSYLYGCNKDDFATSKYFNAWCSLLKNKNLVHYCSQNGIRIIFYPHYSMQHFISLFRELENEVVTIADFNHYDVQTLLKESSLLVTDYSSILFDFAYMRKPQLLYQFDENEFYGKHYQHSYFNHHSDGFGKVCDNEGILIDEILNICKNDFEQDSIYREKVNEFFPIYDDNNSERIYQEIVKKFISKKKVHKFANELNVVVTGDDYGRNFESSEGIRQAFAKNFIQHTSIILNKDEKDCLNLSDIDMDKVSLHINLTEGYQSFGDTNFYAYSVGKETSIACKEFNTRKAYFKLSPQAIDIVCKEVEAQITKYKALGFANLSFDSHGHIHNKLPIAKCIIPIAAKEEFVSYRRPSNVFEKQLSRTIYKKKVARLYGKHFNTTDYFCSCDDFIHIKHYRKFKNKTIEVMTHPFIGKYGLVNRRDIDFASLYNDR